MVDKINLKKSAHANNSDKQPIISNDYIAPLLNGKSFAIFTILDKKNYLTLINMPI